MTITTLRPTITTGDWTNGGSGILSDDSDSSYKIFDNRYQYGLANFNAASLPFGSGIVLKSIHPRARLKSSTGDIAYVRVTGYTALGRGLINDGDSLQFLASAATFQSQSTGTKVIQYAPSDGDIVLALHPLNDLTGFTVQFSELYLDIDYALPPVPTVTLPSGTYTTTSSPPYSFTFFSTDGYSQSAYRYMIYSSAQYGAAGFVPGVSLPTYDSGVILNSQKTGTLYPLPNGTYRVYFSVAQTVNGVLQWSSWSVSTADADYVLGITPPAAASVTATPDNTNARILLAVSGAGAANSTLDVFQVERSFDGGTTWETVRSDQAGGFLENIGGARTWYDYETGNGQSVIYHARTITIDTNGFTLVGAFGSNTGATSWSSTSTWLKIIDRPDLNRTITVRAFGLERYDTTMGTFQGLGSDDVVVVTGTRRSRPDGQVTLLARTDVEQHLLLDILDLGSPLLVQAGSRSSDWKNISKYLEVGDVQVTRPTRAGWSEIRDLTLPYTEIDRPDPGVYTVSLGVNTWQDIDDLYASFTALNAAYATYGAIRG